LIFRRYLGRELVFSLVLIVIVFIALAVTIMLVQFLTRAASGGILGQVVWTLLAINIPKFLLIILPIAVFLSILLVYGRMFYDSELLVAFSCGYSWLKLLRVTVVPAVIVAIIVCALSFYIVPVMRTYGHKLTSQELTGADVAYVRPETFTHIPSAGSWVYSSKLEAGKLQNVFIYAIKNQRPQIVLAKRAYERKKDGVSHLVLTSGHQYLLPDAGNGLRVVKFATFDTEVSVPKIGRDQDLSSRTIYSLWHDRGGNQVFVEICTRIVQPINVFIFVALGLMICIVDRRQGRYGKLFFGVLIYVIYFNVTAILSHWASDGKIFVIPAVFGLQIILAITFLFWLFKQDSLFISKWNKRLTNE
jgi:lipopolysaccharide export system permease protein